MARKTKKLPGEDYMMTTEPVKLADALAELPVMQVPPKPSRPMRPRERDMHEPAAIYTGKTVKLTLDGGDTYNLVSTMPLNREQDIIAVRGGLDMVDDEGKHYQGHRNTVQDRHEPSLLGAMIDGKADRLTKSEGRGR